MNKYELTEKEVKWLYTRPFALCSFKKNPLIVTRCKDCRWWDSLMETCAIRTRDHDWHDAANFNARVIEELARNAALEDAAWEEVSSNPKSRGFVFELLKLAYLKVEQETDDEDNS